MSLAKLLGAGNVSETAWARQVDSYFMYFLKSRNPMKAALYRLTVGFYRARPFRCSVNVALISASAYIFISGIMYLKSDSLDGFELATREGVLTCARRVAKTGLVKICVGQNDDQFMIHASRALRISLEQSIGKNAQVKYSPILPTAGVIVGSIGFPKAQYLKIDGNIIASIEKSKEQYLLKRRITIFSLKSLSAFLAAYLLQAVFLNNRQRRERG